MGCAISGKRGTGVFFWRERGQNYRHIVADFNGHVGEGAVASPLVLTTRCRHESISFVDESLDMANAFGSLDKNTEDVIQPRLREIDRFFFITRRGRLFTEVLVADGIASGLAQVGLFMGDKNAPNEFGAVFQGAIDTWQASVTKKNGGIFGRTLYEDVERSCGVTLFADDVFEKSLLVLGIADECEHTVARRMDEVNSALETCSLLENWWSCPISGGRSKIGSSREEKAGVPDKGFPPLSGHCVSCRALGGR